MKDSLKRQNCTIEQVEEQVNDSQDKPIEFNVRKNKNVQKNKQSLGDCGNYPCTNIHTMGFLNGKKKKKQNIYLRK